MPRPATSTILGRVEVTPLAPQFPGDRNLLTGVRRALHDADEAYLCVAFASSSGVNLLRPSLEPIRHRAGARLLVTTTFGTSTPAALKHAHDLGVDIKVLNPTGGTFHPKVYAARSDDEVSLVVGSANLTAGLINNVEMATFLRGEMREESIALIFEWARDIWRSSAATTWEPSGPVEEEALSPELLALITAAVDEDRVFRTLSQGKPNRVVEVTPQGLWVETERSQAKGKPEGVPAWMIQVAWDYLRAHGELTNRFLLANDGLNVKRSSFVCALLARLPGIEVMNKPMGVRLKSPSGPLREPHG